MTRDTARAWLRYILRDPDSDLLRHLSGLPCWHLVHGHEFVPATHPAWHGERRCAWLPGPQADRCFFPRRCHAGVNVRNP